jgi:transcriptional regulator with XRE-family HTH domain
VIAFDFGRLQRMVRTARGAESQRVFARRVGLTQAQITKLETGSARQLSYDLYTKLTRVLGPLPEITQDREAVYPSRVVPGEACLFDPPRAVPPQRLVIARRPEEPSEVVALCAVIHSVLPNALQRASMERRRAMLEALVAQVLFVADVTTTAPAVPIRDQSDESSGPA